MWAIGAFVRVYTRCLQGKIAILGIALSIFELGTDERYRSQEAKRYDLFRRGRRVLGGRVKLFSDSVK